MSKASKRGSARIWAWPAAKASLSRST